MDPLEDPLRTRRNQTDREMLIEPYPNRQFAFIENPDRQFTNVSVPTWTRTPTGGAEPLLTLSLPPRIRNADHYQFNCRLSGCLG